MNFPAPAAAPHSSFVTSLAWSFLLLAILGTGIYLIQLLMMLTVFSAADYQAIARDLEATQAMPAALVWITRHVYVWIMLMLGLSLLTLFASIALLRRRNWARMVFVWMMMLGVVSNVAGAVAPFFMRATLESFLQTFPVEMRAELQAMATVMTWVSLILAVVFALLFGWCAIKLMSPAIKREFSAG